MNLILVKLLLVSPLFFVSCMANTCRTQIYNTPEKCIALLEKEASLIPSSCDCANFNADDTFSSCCAFGEPCTLSFSGGVGTAGCTADMEATTTTTTTTTTRTTTISWGRVGLFIAVLVVAIAATYWCWRVRRTKRGGNYTAADDGQNKKPDDDVAVATTDVGATTPAAAETQVLEKA